MSTPNIILSWMAPTTGQPDIYNVYFGVNPGSETFLINVPGTQLSYTISGTAPTIHSAYVTAVMNGIESMPSNEVVVIPPPGAPGQPVFVLVNATVLGVLAQLLTINATSMNLVYSTSSSFSPAITLVNVATSGTINITGLLPSTTYYVKFVSVNANNSVFSPLGYQQTLGVNMAVENASVLNGQQLFVETTPGVSGLATVRLLLTQINPDEVPDKKAHMQEGIKFPVEVSEGKEYTSLKYDAQLGFLDMAYLCATCLVKPVVSTPTNSSSWTVAGATGTLGFTFNGQTVAPATYANIAAIQSAIGALSSVGTNNVVVTGTLAAPIIKFVAALSTTVLPLTVSGTPTPTVAPTNTATLTRRWTFLIDPFNPDVLQTYTVEKGVLGQAGMAEIISSVYGTSLQMTVSKTEQKVSGDMIGQLDIDPSTMTTSLATGNVTAIPITAKMFSVFLGDNPNNVQRLTRTQQIEFQTGDRVTPIFTLDDSQASFSAVVEGQVNTTTKITMVHNAQSQIVLTAMRANAQKWLIYEALGPMIEPGFQYRFKITMPVKVIGTQKQSVDGARSAVYDLQPKYDASLGGANGGAILVEMDIPIAQLG